MNTKKFLKLFALITVFALVLCACGAKENAPSTDESAPAEVQSPETAELGLSDWTLDSTIWSSANGAAIDLTATPIAYAEGMTATFVVRLEGEDVVSNPCEWNGKQFTSYADLNAEDGYCYYVVLTGADGSTVTVDINTPTTPFNTSLINLAASLESFCHTTISNASFENGTLTITQGTAQIQTPMIDSGVTCTEADLVMNLDGGALAKVSLKDKLADSVDGSYTIDLAGVSFQVPEMQDDHQITLTLMAELSDGTTLFDEGSTSWFYSDGSVQLTVG